MIKRYISIGLIGVLFFNLICFAQNESDFYHLIDLPYYTEECGTELPVPLTLNEATNRIDSIFLKYGYTITKEHFFDQDSIKFPLTGYSDELNLGYVWLDWHNLSIDAYNLFYYPGGKAFIPDLNSDIKQDVLWELYSHYYKSPKESVSKLASLAMKEVDPIKKKELYTATLEEFILKGVFSIGYFDTTKFNSQIRITKSSQAKQEQLIDLLSYQKILRLQSFYDHDSLWNDLKRVLDTLSLEYSQKVLEEYTEKYESYYVGLGEIEYCISNEDLPMTILFFQANHPSLTVPSRYGHNFHHNFYFSSDVQKFQRLDSILDTYPGRFRERRITKRLKEMETETLEQHLMNIYNRIEQSIVQAMEPPTK